MMFLSTILLFMQSGCDHFMFTAKGLLQGPKTADHFAAIANQLHFSR